MRRLVTHLGVLALVFALLGGAAACTKRQPGHTEQRPRVDRALMACLGALRAYHRQADLHLARADPTAAIAAVEQIVGMKCIQRKNPEIQEAVLDAYGRLARLQMQRGRLDQAAAWLDRGMRRPGPDSFFRANLYMVQGDLLDARAGKLDKEGKKSDADTLRRRAINAFEISSKMNRRLLQELVK
ncbi:MAG: hypothetical protein ABI333_26840 [bacterium]